MSDSEMYDSIDPSQIPAGQDAAGYVDGHWPTFTALHGPNNLSIAVFAWDNADALDDEPGDATNADVAGWVKRQLGLGHWRPCIYTSISNTAAMLAALAAAGISRDQVRVWTAHYTRTMHRCRNLCYPGLPLGFVADATQWTDNSGGRNLDESTVAADFFAAAPKPGTATRPPILLGDNVQKIDIPGGVRLDAAGWTCVDVPLPAGMNHDNVVCARMDCASAFDPQSWQWCQAEPDFNQPTAGHVRMVFKGSPGQFFTGRIVVA